MSEYAPHTRQYVKCALCVYLSHTHSFLNQHNPGCTLLMCDYVPVHNHRVSVLNLRRDSVISLM